MLEPFADLTADDAAMRILSALFIRRRPHTVPELSCLTQLPAEAVAALASRMTERGVLRPDTSHLGEVYSVGWDEPDGRSLARAVERWRQDTLERRARIFSARRARSLDWIDETLRSLRAISGRLTR